MNSRAISEIEDTLAADEKQYADIKWRHLDNIKIIRTRVLNKPLILFRNLC
jgi:hypothetical protein